MYGRPGVIYGFHGCDRRIGEAVLASHTQHLHSSQNDYDWLGHGVYFWEASPLDANLSAYDTVIGALWEGNDLYDEAGVTDKNHMQICVRKDDCIRGYFRVRELEGVDLTRWDSHPCRARPRTRY